MASSCRGLLASRPRRIACVRAQKSRGCRFRGKSIRSELTKNAHQNSIRVRNVRNLGRSTIGTKTRVVMWPTTRRHLTCSASASGPAAPRARLRFRTNTSHRLRLPLVSLRLRLWDVRPPRRQPRVCLSRLSPRQVPFPGHGRERIRLRLCRLRVSPRTKHRAAPSASARARFGHRPPPSVVSESAPLTLALLRPPRRRPRRPLDVLPFAGARISRAWAQPASHRRDPRATFPGTPLPRPRAPRPFACDAARNARARGRA